MTATTQPIRLPIEQVRAGDRIDTPNGPAVAGVACGQTTVVTFADGTAETWWNGNIVTVYRG